MSKNVLKIRDPRCASVTHETPILKFGILAHKTLFFGKDGDKKYTKAVILELAHFCRQSNINNLIKIIIIIIITSPSVSDASRRITLSQRSLRTFVRSC